MTAQAVPLSEAEGAGAALERALILATCTAVTFLYAMTVTIANVSLPQMQGALSVTPDQIAWVVTSNIVATAVMTPLAGWLTSRFGRRRLCNACVLGFGAASLGCGMADSLEELVLFRVLQGALGAPLVPLSQAIVLDTYAKRQHGAVIALFGMGSVLGPIVGPMAGGWLAEAYNWRWVFYMIVPFALLTFIGTLAFIHDREAGSKVRLDWLGFLLLSTALACTQLMLDRGERRDLAEFGYAANLGDRGLGVLHRPVIKQGGELGYEAAVLARRDRDAAGLADGTQALAVFGRKYGLLEPIQLHRREPLADRDGILDIPFAVDVEQQRGRLRHGRPRRRDHRFADFVQFDRAEALADCLLAVPGGQRRVRVAQQARIAVETLAPRAAEQRMQGLACGLASDVPERDVQARKRERSDAESPEDMQPLLDLGMQTGDIRCIPSDRDRRDHVPHRRGDGTAAGVRERFAPARDAGVGVHPHQAEIERLPAAGAQRPALGAVAAGDRKRDCFDADDLHPRAPTRGNRPVWAARG